MSGMEFKARVNNRTIEVRENALDRAIGVVAPGLALRRFRSRVQMALSGSYHGASTTRVGTRSWTPSLTDADSDILFDLPMLRARSRDEIRNNPIAGGAVNTTVTNVVGRGLVPQSTIDRSVLNMSDDEADEWEGTTEREFALFAESKNASLERALNFYEQQDVVFRQTLENGDVFALSAWRRRPDSPYGLTVQLIEADRVGGPQILSAGNGKIVSGVEKDADGAAVAIHVANRNAYSAVDRRALKYTRVDVFAKRTGRRQVLQLYRHLRLGQTRGVPFLAPVIATLKQLSRYHEAELQAAIVAGLFTVFIKSQDAEGNVSVTPAENITTDETKDEIKLSAGGLVALAPGEDVTAPNPGRPNAAFDPFVQSLTRYIGIALEIPYEVLVKHFTASYSAARAALLEAWKFFYGRRSWLEDNYCKPVYEWWMDEAVALGRISAPGYFDDPILRQAYLGSKWTGPAKGMINEKAEVEAAVLRLENDISTLTEETAQLTGGDWATNHRQRIKERQARKAAGVDAQTAKPKPDNAKEEDPDRKEDETETEVAAL